MVKKYENDKLKWENNNIEFLNLSNISIEFTLEKLKKITKQFKTRTQFGLKNKTAYTYARLNGFLDEICSHMIVSNLSVPENILRKYLTNIFENYTVLYNSRRIISPYELDIYFPEIKLAFEYNGSYWHSEKNINLRDINKIDLCSKLDITLIVIPEKSKNYKADIKNDLIFNLEIIKKFIPTVTEEFIENINIDIDDIYNSLYDWDDIREICSRYSVNKTFMEEQFSIYNLLQKTNRLKEFTSHMKRRKTYWTDEMILSEVSKYNTVQEFKKHSKTCYNYVTNPNKNKRHLMSSLQNIKCIHISKWTIEKIQGEISRYEYLKDFEKKSHSCYEIVRERGLQYLLEPLKRKGYTIDELNTEISKFTHYKDFREKSKNMYSYIQKNKEFLYLLDNLIKTEFIPLYSDEEILETISKYEYLKEFRKENISMNNFIYKYKKTYMLSNLKYGPYGPKIKN